jgi:hypothetical protein
MKHSILILIFVGVFFLSDLQGQSGIKTNGTAYPIGYRKGEVSLFQNGRYGIGRKSEINAHPLAFFMMPHIHYKQYWTSFNLSKYRIAFATRHGAYYPQIMLNFARNQAFIPEDFRPDMKASPAIGFNNELLFSTYLKPATHCDAPNHLLSLKLGIKYAYNFDTLFQTRIYKPVLHRETTVLSPKLVWNAQLSITGEMGNYLYYYGDLAFHSYRWIPKQFSAESKLGLYGYLGQKTSVFGGIKLAYTHHTDLSGFGFYPLVNICYHFRVKPNKKKQRGLFEDGFDFDEFKQPE